MTISYFDTNQPRSSRQIYLQQNYHFSCLCNRCEEEGKVPSSSKITYPKSKNCSKKNKIPKKKQLWKSKDE